MLTKTGGNKASAIRRWSSQTCHLLHAFTDNASDAVQLVDPRTLCYLDVNQPTCDMLGYSREELRKMAVWEIDVGSDALALKRIDNILGTSATAQIETVFRRKDGSCFPVEVNIKRVTVERPYNVVFVRDIAARQWPEREQLRLGWVLQALRQSNAAIVGAPDEKTLCLTCCNAIATVDAYPLVWIGAAHSDGARGIEFIAVAGSARSCLNGKELSLAEDVLGAEGPVALAIRTGASQVIDDISVNPVCRSWRKRASAHHLASLIALPIRVNGGVFGILAIYSREPASFGAEASRMLEDLAGIIGYGIATRRTHAAYLAGLEVRARQTIQLRAAFESTVAALAATVEQRDPYTAGHQRRVSDLAVTIGRELGLEEERLRGLRVAASLHDIGNISIPGEILTRPGRLSSMEMEFVRTHVKAGYDIIKGIDFPWPVAEAIYQHHERMDGSGYPRGLKGEEIIIEARILAVADSVEAMSSHRPYRSGEGLDSALAQIRAESATKLDASVVTACCKVFEGMHYQLPV